MKIPNRLPQYQHRSTALVVLNGSSGDLVPDLDLETFGCNGNFLRRRLDHVVSLDHPRVQFARQHGRTVWTRPRFCRSGDIRVPESHTIFNDSGNAAIWAAHQLYDHVIIAGADSWLGGESWTVCRELYAVSDKKAKLPGMWFRKFLDWSSQTSGNFEFIWTQPHEKVKIIGISDVINKYSVTVGNLSNEV
jgi:hypothetical protein